MQANCYIVATQQGHAVLVDPGDQGDHLARGLGTMGLTPVWVLLTHGHFDHVGGLQRLRELYPSIQVAAGEKEAALLADPALNLAAVTAAGDLERYTGLRADRLVHEGDTIQVDELTFTVLETPGHTAGGVCYLCEDLLFTGDTLFQGSVGRTDFPTGSVEELSASTRRLSLLEGNLRVLPGHGEPSTLEIERASNPFVRS